MRADIPIIDKSDVMPGAPSRQTFVAAGYLPGFALVASLFFLWAIANNLNDILIRQFQHALDLNRAQAGFIQFAFYLGYFTMALPAGFVARRFGYRVGILTGLALYAAGALLFYPAADVRAYSFFLFALFVIASGAAFLETTSNPYIVAFGDPARAAQRLNLAQSFNGLGATVAPIIGGLFIFSGAEPSAAQLAAMSPVQLSHYRAAEAQAVQMPYLALACVIVAIALGLALVKLPEVRQRALPRPPGAGVAPILREPGLLGAIVTQFFYVGAQVGVWSFFVDFVKDVLPSTPERTAAFGLSASLFLFMAGRFIGTAAMQRIRPVRLLLVYGLVNVALCAVAIGAPGLAAVIALGLTSFFMSIMFPTIFSFGVADLGPRAELGASLIIMAIIGGAVFPPLMGWITQASGSIRLAMALPLFCFAAVALYAHLVPRWHARAVRVAA